MVALEPETQLYAPQHTEVELVLVQMGQLEIKKCKNTSQSCLVHSLLFVSLKLQNPFTPTNHHSCHQYVISLMSQQSCEKPPTHKVHWKTEWDKLGFVSKAEARETTVVTGALPTITTTKRAPETPTLWGVKWGFLGILSQLIKFVVQNWHILFHHVLGIKFGTKMFDPSSRTETKEQTNNMSSQLYLLALGKFSITSLHLNDSWIRSLPLH